MKIIKSFKEEEALKLYHTGKMFDLLPRLNPLSDADEVLLDKTCNRLEYEQVPYLVIRSIYTGRDGVDRDNIKLWKEKYV